MCLNSNNWPFSVETSIQIVGFILALVTLYLIYRQVKIFAEDAQMRQRPFVGLMDIESVFLGGKELSKELDKTDEILFIIRIGNVGLSNANISHMNIKMYYAYYICTDTKSDFGDLIQNKKLMVNDFFAKQAPHQMNQIDYGEEVPVSPQCFHDIVMIPNQSTNIEVMSHALELKQRIVSDKKHPLPIILEISIKYTDIWQKVHFHNSLHSVTWLPAHHNKITTRIERSNNNDDRLFLTLGALVNMLKRSTDM